MIEASSGDRSAILALFTGNSASTTIVNHFHKRFNEKSLLFWTTKKIHKMNKMNSANLRKSLASEKRSIEIFISSSTWFHHRQAGVFNLSFFVSASFSPMNWNQYFSIWINEFRIRSVCPLPALHSTIDVIQFTAPNKCRKWNTKWIVHWPQRNCVRSTQWEESTEFLLLHNNFTLKMVLFLSGFDTL